MPRIRDNSMKLLLLIALPFLGSVAVGCLWVGGYNVHSWFKAEEVRTHWPTCQGRVLSSELVRSKSSDQKDSSHVSITYEYSVAGRVYKSDDIRVGWDIWVNGEDAAVVRRFPAGSTCTVYYNQANPDESVLVAEAGTIMVVFLSIGLCFGFIPLVVVISLLRGALDVRRLARAPQLLASAGRDSCHIGQVKITSGSDQLRIAQPPHLLGSAITLGGAAAFASVFLILFRFQDRSVHEQMRMMLWIAGGGFLAGLWQGAVWHSIVFDVKTGTLTRTIRRLGWTRRSSWPIKEIKELAIGPNAQTRRTATANHALTLKVQPTSGRAVKLLSEMFGNQTLMLTGAMLADKMERPLACHDSIKIKNVSTALAVIEAMELKNVLTVDHTAKDPSAEMPAWLQDAGNRLKQRAENFGIPIDQLTRQNDAQSKASTTGDPLTQGRPAAEALATEGMFSHVGRFARTAIPTILGIVLATAGLFIMCMACIMPMVETVRAVNWPTTTGMVTEVGRKTSDSGDTHRPLVRYTYTVARKEYERDSPFRQVTSSSATGWIEPVLARYHPGQNVVVHYKPADPACSALELRVSGTAIGVLGFAGAFILGGFGLANWAQRDQTLRKQFSQLFANRTPLTYRLGRFRFDDRGDELDTVWRPSRLRAALITWVALAAVLGIVMLILSPGAVTEITVAWGLPLVAALGVAHYAKRVEQRLAVVGTGPAQTVQWSRRGWLGKQDIEERPASEIKIVYIHAKQYVHSSKNGRSRVTFKPELRLIFSHGDPASPLDYARNATVVAVAAVALMRSLDRPLWISRRLDNTDQVAIRGVLDIRGQMDRVRVIGDIQDTSWDERLEPDPKAE